MIDFLNPNIIVIGGAIVVLIFLWFIQLSINNDQLVWFIWVPMLFIALYLLWVGGSWLVGRFMEGLHSY